MLMSVVEEAQSVQRHPELAGKRVLITGLSRSAGVDLARAFAEHRARLILQFAEACEDMDAVAEIAAQSALEIQSFGPVACSSEAAVAFARTAVQAFGGLDAVINVIPLAAPAAGAGAQVEDLERLVAERLRLPLHLSQIAANRMAMMMTEGMVLNVAAVQAKGQTKWAFASMVKAALSGMTRAQAEEWAGKGIRFNAIAPQTSTLAIEPGLNGEASVAMLALYLASSHGRRLSGHVFEADCARC
ncbi:MAG: SDR family oxidoreductase [Hyphomicrobiaceae bacterium]|nr:SDR family oxidoreductase [Hyphomicrobiaceae bacterium]